MDRISLPADDEALLAECEVETFRSGGPGGQHVNKTESAVRLSHRPTGLVVTCQQERSQYLNRLLCLRKLREKVERLNYRPPRRVATKVPGSAKAKSRKGKIRQSSKKRLRGRPDWDGDD